MIPTQFTTIDSHSEYDDDVQQQELKKVGGLVVDDIPHDAEVERQQQQLNRSTVTTTTATTTHATMCVSCNICNNGNYNEDSSVTNIKKKERNDDTTLLKK